MSTPAFFFLPSPLFFSLPHFAVILLERKRVTWAPGFLTLFRFFSFPSSFYFGCSFFLSDGRWYKSRIADVALILQISPSPLFPFFLSLPFPSATSFILLSTQASLCEQFLPPFLSPPFFLSLLFFFFEGGKRLRALRFAIPP